MLSVALVAMLALPMSSPSGNLQGTPLPFAQFFAVVVRCLMGIIAFESMKRIFIPLNP